MDIEIAVELIVAGLLSAAIVWAVVLDRRLRDLRSGKDGVKQAVMDLAGATARAEAAIASLREAAETAGARLANAQAGAKSTSEELSLLVGAAEGLADRLAAQRAQMRPLPQRPAMPNLDLKGAR
jgi:Domain of unknown function (DUF6468)